MKYTILFHFPFCDAYPTYGIGYSTKITEKVRTFDDMQVAEKFANEMCGKFDFEIVEIPA